MAQRETSTRRAVTDALFVLAGQQDKVILVSSDSAAVIKAQDFQAAYPDQVVEMGIAEQAAMCCAAGLAASGLKPVYATYAVFATMRACEQFRTMIAYPGMSVTVVGANGGMGSGEREGVSHQGLEDIGIMRAIPKTTVLVPSDAGQVTKAVIAASDIEGPVYIRIGSGKEPLVHEEDTPFPLYSTRTLYDAGTDAVIFTCGFVLPQVLRACSKLEEQGIKVRAVEIATVKPLPTDEVQNHIAEARTVFTVEDHNIIGGLGSAVAEVSDKYVNRVGLEDVFPESGSSDELFDAYGLSEEHIIKLVSSIVNHKV